MQDWHGKEAENVARIVETDSKSKVLQIFHPKKTLWLQFSKKKTSYGFLTRKKHVENLEKSIHDKKQRSPCVLSENF